MVTKSKNVVFIISGPSGVGKDTLVTNIINIPELNLQKTISCTTRPQRPNEVDGQNYYFVNLNHFEKMIKNKEFIEWTIYSLHRYGTTFKTIDNIIKNNKNPILIIDIDGREQIISALGNKYEIRTIFLLPPNLNILRKRLIERGVNVEEDLHRRLEIAKNEIIHSKQYNHIIKMKKLKKEIKDISKYMKKEYKKLNNE